MITVRQLERLWQSRSSQRLVGDLLALRPEYSLILEAQCQNPVAAAALALLRLDEIGQSNVPLARTLLCSILEAQQADGGWADPITTALALRALVVNDGHGLAVDRTLAYLAHLQKTDGAWPNSAVRRLPADGMTTGMVLLALAEVPKAPEMVRFDDALTWMRSHEETFDPTTSKLWSLVQRRTRSARRLTYPATQWS